MTVAQIAALVPLAAAWLLSVISILRTPSIGVVSALMNLAVTTLVLGVLAVGVARRWTWTFYALIGLYLVFAIYVPSLWEAIGVLSAPPTDDPFWSATLRDLRVSTVVTLALVITAVASAIVMIVVRVRVGTWGTRT